MLDANGNVFRKLFTDEELQMEHGNWLQGDDAGGGGGGGGDNDDDDDDDDDDVPVQPTR